MSDPSLTMLLENASQLRNSIAYLEIRLARTEISIAELCDRIHDADHCDEDTAQPTTKSAGNGKSVREILLETLGSAPDQIMHRKELLKAATEKYPDVTEKIRRGGAVAIYESRNRGEIEGLNDGLLKLSDGHSPKTLSIGTVNAGTLKRGL